MHRTRRKAKDPRDERSEGEKRTSTKRRRRSGCVYNDDDGGGGEEEEEGGREDGRARKKDGPVHRLTPSFLGHFSFSDFSHPNNIIPSRKVPKHSRLRTRSENIQS